MPTRSRKEICLSRWGGISDDVHSHFPASHDGVYGHLAHATCYRAGGLQFVIQFTFNLSPGHAVDQCVARHTE